MTEKISHCYVCDLPITVENVSKEHIIINAAGGRLASKNLLCKKCNNSFGETIDAELARQLNFLSNFLLIKRYDGDPPAIIGTDKETGEKYKMTTEGHLDMKNPTVTFKDHGDHKEVSIAARNKKELVTILNNIKKKYPLFDVENALRQANEAERYLDKPLQFSMIIGGVTVERAVCKCAINYFIEMGGDSKWIKHLIPFIKGEVAKKCVCLFYPSPIYELQDDECFHLLHLVGSLEEGILYCYVDYFNSHKYLVLLSEEYSGPAIEKTYCYNILNQSVIQKRVNLKLTKALVSEALASAVLMDEIKKNLIRSWNIGNKRQHALHMEKLVKNAMEEWHKNHPDVENLSQENMEDFLENVSFKLAKYLSRGISKT